MNKLIICAFIISIVVLMTYKIKSPTQKEFLFNSCKIQTIESVFYNLMYGIMLAEFKCKREVISAEQLLGIVRSIDISDLPENFQKDYSTTILIITKNLSTLPDNPHISDEVGQSEDYYARLRALGAKYKIDTLKIIESIEYQFDTN